MSLIPAYNLHIHTYRCQHAVGDALEFAQLAAQAGCPLIGISDHCPMPDGRWSDVRMRMEDLHGYVAAIRLAQAKVPGVRTLAGMECEWAPELRNFYEEVLLGELELDYLIGAGHYIERQGAWHSSFNGLDQPGALTAYAAQVTRLMESGLFLFLAHPDLFGCSYEDWNPNLTACSRDILQAAVETNTPLEINGNGFRKGWRKPGPGRNYPYPFAPFWELAAEYPVQVMLNSDAHHPQELFADLDQCQALADRYRLRLWQPPLAWATPTPKKAD